MRTKQDESVEVVRDHDTPDPGHHLAVKFFSLPRSTDSSHKVIISSARTSLQKKEKKLMMIKLAVCNA